MSKQLNREEAWALLTEYNQDPFHLHHAPEIHLVAVAELLREIAHDALDRAGMMQMERILVILRQQCPGFLPVQLLAHSKAS